MKPILTIFTPTFNRAHTLHLCYGSLKRQTCKNFKWMIIDDGSTDGTKDLVEAWKKENVVPIQYIFQTNLGMHGAHNTAYSLIDTELNVCIDSDDYLADNAVEKIVSYWKNYGGPEYAGIAGLDATPHGEIIGTHFPKGLNAASHSEIYGRYKVKGDKKLVYRSELTKKVPPYPIYEAEKYGPLAYKYLLIDQIAPLLVLNEILCYVEYLPDGSSMNIIKQYKNNPQGFSFYRKAVINFAPTFKEKFRASIHYVASNLMLKNYTLIIDSPRKLITLFSLPFGIILYIFLQTTEKKTIIKS